MRPACRWVGRKGPCHGVRVRLKFSRRELDVRVDTRVFDPPVFVVEVVPVLPFVTVVGNLVVVLVVNFSSPDYGALPPSVLLTEYLNSRANRNPRFNLWWCRLKVGFLRAFVCRGFLFVESRGQFNHGGLGVVVV